MRTIKLFLNDPTKIDQWRKGVPYVFPSLKVTIAMGEWEDDENCLLSLKTPQLDEFEEVKRKTLYISCVKASNGRFLRGVPATKWTEFLGTNSSPRGCWRSLYKRPIDKRTGDLQWRIIHGAIATNRHVVHLDPSVGVGCPFCSEVETVFHLFVQCSRLNDLFTLLSQWFAGIGEGFSFEIFIYGPKYSASRKNMLTLLNFLSGTAKLAIWKSRKNKLLGEGSLNVLNMFMGLVAARLRIEHAYYKLIKRVEVFIDVWGINDVLCTVNEDGDLLIAF